MLRAISNFLTPSTCSTNAGCIRLPHDLEQPVSVQAVISQSCQRIFAPSSPEDSCPVCLEELKNSCEELATGLLKVKSCGHALHSRCLERWLTEQRRCPVCAVPCGVQFGTGPKTGSMSWHHHKQSLPGYENTSCFIVTFKFPAGSDDSGMPYQGRTAVAYLPDVEEGRMVLKLFQIAFRRRLMFSVGTSLTLGTRWPTFNIHLKTNMNGGSSQHGYPDSEYLKRALQELASCGVLPDTAPMAHEVSSPVSWRNNTDSSASRCRSSSTGSSLDVRKRNSAKVEFLPTPQTKRPRNSTKPTHASENAPPAPPAPPAPLGPPAPPAPPAPSVPSASSEPSAPSAPPVEKAKVQELADSDSEVEMVKAESARQPRSASGSAIPCEICGVKVPFDSYMLHVTAHDNETGNAPVENNGAIQDNAIVGDVDNDLIVLDECVGGSANKVPCDVCGQMVAFADFAAHAAEHIAHKAEKQSSANAKPCQICGAMIEPEDLNDHMEAHRVHDKLVDSELGSSTSEVDITLQIVEMARKEGSGLLGNRTSVNPGDEALVRWSDGNWYAAILTSIHADGRHHVSWDKPYESWAPEDVAADAVIPRVQHAREVCNFDVALAFVKRLKACAASSSSHGTHALELVYHWTREENVQKIIENNLKVPNAANSDGSVVQMRNGKAFGSGIYCATTIQYGQAFGAGLSCAFMCLAIPGQTCTGRQIQKGKDSLQHGNMRVYKDSDQLLPLFFTDLQRATTLETAALRIVAFLNKKLFGSDMVEPTFQVGTSVLVLESGRWWQARVQKVHSHGAYDVSWLPPYTAWAPALNVPAVRVRDRVRNMSKS